jgi:hypothetical protein
MSSLHDAIENLPPEPPTPTISTVSSSDMSFEDIPAMGDTSSAKEYENDLDEHPTLYIREDMVKIRVRGCVYVMLRADRSDSRFNAHSSGSRSTS